jgi:hypothetical protein
VSLSDKEPPQAGMVVSSSLGSGVSYVPLLLAEQRARETGMPQTQEDRNGVFWGLVWPPVVDSSGGQQP